MAPTTTRIIGIDPGYALTGYGIIDKCGNKLSVVDYGVIETKPTQDFPVRLLAINDKIKYVLEAFHPDVMAIEEIFFCNNKTTVIGASQGRGVVVVEAARANIPVYEFTPNQVKVGVTGYGRADKKQVSDMVVRLLGLKEAPKPDDVTDALAVAICLAYSGPRQENRAVSGYQYGRYGYIDPKEKQYIGIKNTGRGK